MKGSILISAAWRKAVTDFPDFCKTCRNMSRVSSDRDDDDASCVKNPCSCGGCCSSVVVSVDGSSASSSAGQVDSLTVEENDRKETKPRRFTVFPKATTDEPPLSRSNAAREHRKTVDEQGWTTTLT